LGRRALSVVMQASQATEIREPRMYGRRGSAVDAVHTDRAGRAGASWSGATFWAAQASTAAAHAGPFSS